MEMSSFVKSLLSYNTNLHNYHSVCKQSESQLTEGEVTMEPSVKKY